jgi:hypothetical protein
VIADPVQYEDDSGRETRSHFDEETGIVADVTLAVEALIRSWAGEDAEVIGPLWCTGSLGPDAESPPRHVMGPYAIDDATVEAADWSIAYLVPLERPDTAPQDVVAALEDPAGANGCKTLSRIVEEHGFYAFSAFVVDRER